MGYQAAIFDMDGTILNTLEDLTTALNYAMGQAGHRHDFSAEEVRLFFGNGAKMAVAAALRRESGPAQAQDISRVLAHFQAYYPSHCTLHTRPYAGILELLAALRRQGIRTAVVSNKMDTAVQALCDRHFSGCFDAVLGEREPEIRRKPAPDMTEAALRTLGIDRAEAVYIGDSEVDIQTAQNAGLDCICVSWGFRSRQSLEAHRAACIADDVPALSRMLLG